MVAMYEEDTLVRSAVDSRPCYRCACYMHSVGVKRVFWTNGAGGWEGVKVRELVDMLEGGGGARNGEGSGVAGLGVFVTKHEVLTLRRLFEREGMVSSSSISCLSRCGGSIAS